MSGGWAFTPEWSNNQAIGTSTASSFGAILTISTSSVNVKNTYTQLTASTVGDINALEVYQIVNPIPVNSTIYTDIAVGGAGSEVIIANNLITGGPSPNTAQGNRYYLPVNIPSGSRVAARYALSSSTTTTTGTVTALMQINGFENGMVGAAAFAGVDSIGQSTGVGTVLQTTTTANIKSAYYQLSASSARDYAGFIMGFNTGNGVNLLVDVSVGAAGSEKNIITNYYINNGANTGISSSLPIMIPIPSGTRLAARAQSGTLSGFVGLSLYGIYE